jgi:hypothetical protein
MFGNLKRLGVIIGVLVTAMAGIASPATAQVTHDFEAESTPYILTGTSFGKEPSFEFSSGAMVSCSASGFNGTITSSPTQELTVQPTYENCTLSGVAATIDTPCNNIFTGSTNAFEHATVHIECPVGNSVKITVNGCTILIGGQTPEQGAHYTNTGSGSSRDVDFKVTMKNAAYEKVGALCGLIAGLGGELSILGEYTMKAYKDVGGAEGGQTGFWTKATIT